MSTEKFLFQIAADTAQLRSELKSSQTEVAKLKKGVNDSNTSFSSFTAGATKLAGGLTIVATAAAAAAVAVGAYATAQGRSIRETEALATMAGVTSEEFKKMSFVMGTAGISGEKYGDIMKDTQEKVGDFLATGGGAFQDFADVMGYTETQANQLAQEFENMTGPEVLQAMVNRMQDAGKSTQQMSFALEGMASDTTRLIPLLKDNGRAAKELGEQYDEINIELTDEEKQQYADLAKNVDLATVSFQSMLQNAIAPLVPKLNEMLGTLTEMFKTSAIKGNVFRLTKDPEYAKSIDDLSELNATLDQVITDRIAVGEKIGQGTISNEQAFGRLSGLADAEDALNLRKAELEVAEALAKIDKEFAPKEEAKNNKTTSGADDGVAKDKLLKDLETAQDSKKSHLKLLEEEKEERLNILKSMYDGEKKLTEEQETEKAKIKEQIEADYLEKAREIAKTDEEEKIDALVSSQKQLEEVLNAKLITQEEYQAALREMIGEYAPETLDPEALEEKNQLELEMLTEKLENQLITYEDYFKKLGALQKKDGDDKKKKTDLENTWSNSSVKKQLDDGTALLTSIGNNSKKTHKIKQGLAAANAGMNTAEGVTKALASQDYVGAGITALAGLAQVASILSSNPDGGGGSTVSPGAAPTEQPTPSFNEQSTTVTDISEGENNSQILKIEFNDEVIDAVATRVDKSRSDGRT